MERDAQNRPKKFNMSMPEGVISALGMHMYTSIAKSLVEFIANAYDSDAENVTVLIPYRKIEKEKEAMNEKNTEGVKILEKSLDDENLKIIVEDDGHGMDPDEIQERFLPIQRNRRKSNCEVSDKKKRRVTGRKGIGKLAGFGVAEKIIVETKKENEKYKTVFTLDYNKLLSVSQIEKHSITPEYIDADSKEHGTKITLLKLKYGLAYGKTKNLMKSTKNSTKKSIEKTKSPMDEIRKTIMNNFLGIEQEDFNIFFKDPDHPNEFENPLKENIAYKFFYPNDDGSFAKGTIDVPNIESFNYQYIVKFRYRKNDKGATEIKEAGFEIGSMNTSQRGARIYCNNRLAMGPDLLGLHTRMTNYLAHSYMECIVIANELDEKFPDFINSSRTAFITNEVTQPFLDAIADHMRNAITKDAKRLNEEKGKENGESIYDEFKVAIKHLDVNEKKWLGGVMDKIEQHTNVEAGDHKEIVDAILEGYSPISSENRKSWIPSDVENFVPDGEDRARDMFKELSQPSILNITKAKNASAVLTRTFIETSVKHYLKKNGVEITYNDRTMLSKRMREVIAIMKKNKLPQNIINQGEKLLADDSRIEGLKGMNEWVHSASFSPYIEDIITSWNNYKNFIIECWRK